MFKKDDHVYFLYLNIEGDDYGMSRGVILKVNETHGMGRRYSVHVEHPYSVLDFNVEHPYIISYWNVLGICGV